jgi:PAS domain S-box-containing protein
MSSSTPSPAAVFAVFDRLAPPGTPFTTAEVAAEFDCSDRTVHSRLDALVEEGVVETKAVGKRGRVWWQPVDDTVRRTVDTADGVPTGKRLREPKERLQVALDVAGVGTWEWDLEAQTVRCDETTLTLFGLPPTDEPVPVERFFGEESAGVAQVEDAIDASFDPGEEIQAELRLEHSDPPRWISWRGRACADDPSVLRGVSFDVTQRKRAEDELQRQVELDVFRVELINAIRLLSDPVEIQHEAARVVGEHLDVDRAHYGEVLADGDTNVVHADYYREDVPSVVGEHKLSDFGDVLPESFRAGETMAIDDISTMPGLSDEERAAYVDNRIGAWMNAPLLKDGKLTGYFTVTQSTPREWTETEITIVEETADRTWAAVERARAEQALQESERRYRTLFEEMDEGFALNELVRNADGQVCDVRYSELNEAFEELTGASRADAEGRLASEVFPGQEDEFFETFGRVAETGESAHVENYVPANDRWYHVRMFPRERNVIAVLYDEITDRKRLEKQLRTEKEQLDVAVANSPLVLFRLDADLRYTWVKNPTEDFVDVDVLGKRDDEFLPPETAEVVMAPKRTVLETGETVREEVTYDLPSGRFTYDLTIAPLRDGSGEITGLTCAALDVTEQKRMQWALERLNAATRELMDASPETISDRVASLTLDVFGVEHASLWRYDEADGELREYDSRSKPGIEPHAERLPDDFAEELWRAFIGDGPDVVDDLGEHEGGTSSLRCRVLVPVGRHGVICAESTDAGAFDDRSVQFIETVAATVAAAWDRADGAESLARQNEELAHLEELYSLMWQIDQALVEADTVDAVDEAVCEHLAASEFYEFAWVGEFDANGDTIEPRAWAGIESASLEDLVAAADEPVAHESPFAASIRTGQIQVVPDIATDARAAPWRASTLERGARSCLSVPLVHDESVYGVLVVYARSTLRDERDAGILDELGQTVAHAVHAIEARVTERTDSVVELTLRSSMAETPLVRLTRDADFVIEFEGLVPGSDGEATVFFTARGVTPDELVAAGEQSLAIEKLVYLTDRGDGSLCETRVTDSTLAAGLLDRGAAIRSLTIDSGTATAVVELPETADVRGFVDDVKRDASDLDLLARRSRTRPPDTEHRLHAALDERLSPRQREVLQMAYRSGFFESPRIRTGSELAAALDISQSTFSYHLREAERRLLKVAFDDE